MKNLLLVAVMAFGFASTTFAFEVNDETCESIVSSDSVSKSVSSKDVEGDVDPTVSDE